MEQHYAKIELKENFFSVQKLIDTQWVNKAKLKDINEANKNIEDLVRQDSKTFKKFQYRLIRIEEISLYKSIEKKPDDVTDIF